MKVFLALGRGWVSTICASWFVVLIVLPTTAPFQTIDLTELLGGHARHDVRCGLRVSRRYYFTESAISILPGADGTAERLKLNSRAVSDIRTQFLGGLLGDRPPASPLRPPRAPLITALRV